MRSIARSTAALLGVVLASSGVSAQITSDIRDLKPSVMLLVDTSGSMERVPGENTLPTCDTSSDVKNRWAVVIETLTGQILGGAGGVLDGFQCTEESRDSAAYADEYDYGYHLPHYEFMDFDHDGTVDVDQAAGLIDMYSDRVRFGLMTFDGVGTILGENPLMPEAELVTFDYQDEPGMFSYGDNKELFFPGCEFPYSVNAGARRKAKAPADEPVPPAGALISLGTSDSGPNVTANANLVQESLIRVRPFGGTPTAALLDDLKYYLEHDDDVRLGGDDPYAACRDRFALLLTDGAPDPMFRDARYNCDGTATDPVATCDRPAGEGDGDPEANGCDCPYKLSEDTAADLVTSGLLKQLFVVAFDVGDDAAALAELERMTDAGNDGSLDGDGELLSADDSAALFDRIGNILTDLSPGIATRTVPVSVAQQVSASGSTIQYEIRSGFRFTPTTGLREGFLERRRFGCAANGTPTEIDIEEQDQFEKVLNAQTGRDIRTFALPSGEAPAGTVLGSTLSTDLNGYSLPTTQIDFRGDSVEPPASSSLEVAPLSQDAVASSVDSDKFEDYVSSAALAAEYLGPTADVAKIVKYLSVDGVADTSDPFSAHRLRDILHSTPAVLLPNDRRTKSRAINAFRTAMGTRPNTVFVGTNDGAMHAFSLDGFSTSSPTFDAGEEFWGFVPPTLFSLLPNAASPTHVPMFDGSPIVRDMVLVQNRGSATPVSDCDPRSAVTGYDTYCFGTVLLAPVRSKAAFVALDVTHLPGEPTPLWQLSDGQLGKTVGAPALAQVDLDIGTGLQRRAIAILPGGEGKLDLSGSAAQFGAWSEERVQPTAPTAADGTIRSGGRKWKSTGRLLLVVDVRSGKVLRRFDSRFFPAPLSGAVVADGDGVAPTRFAYVTDADGVLWRLSMLDTDPSKWTVEPIWDVFHNEEWDQGQESSFAPVLTQDTEGNTIIVLGTGSLDSTQDADAQHYVVSLKQTFASDGTLDVTANWEYALQAAEVVTGPLSLLEDIVYFGTLLPFDSGDTCSSGTSRLWGLHYTKKDDADGLPLAGLVPNTGTELVRFEDQGSTLGTDLVLGVGITREPVCVVGTVDNDPIIGSRFLSTAPTGGGAFQLRGLRSGTSNTASGPIKTAMADVTRALSTSFTSRVISQAGSLE